MTIGANFTGNTFGVNVSAIPADADGAIGPSHFVEFINGAFSVYNKTTGQSVKRITDLQFWSNAGLIISPDAATTDPRVIYDPLSQRWFASMIDFSSSASDPALLANNFLLAVSDTPNPTLGWHGFLFQADPDNGTFADFPTLGVDGTGVYLSGDMYRGSNFPLGPSLVSFPKADLLASPPTIANRSWFGVMTYDARGDVLQPVSCFDGSVAGRILAPTDIGSDSNPHSNLVSFAVLNAGNAGATLSASTVIPTLSWVVPDNLDFAAPLLTAHQPDGTSALMANDARLSARAMAVNGLIYAVQNTEFNGRLAIRWYRVRAFDNLLLESGTIADPNLDLFFPSIAANSQGVVVIGYNASGGTTAISCYAMAGQTVNGVTSFGSPLVLQTGAVSYHGLDEVLAQLLGDPPFSRWGDYSATTVDPSNPNHFWTIQMFPSDPADDTVWSTRVTQLITSPGVMLTIRPSGNNVVLSWPITATAYHLQSAASLQAPVAWSAVGQTPLTNGASLTVTLPASGQQFFRLSQ